MCLGSPQPLDESQRAGFETIANNKNASPPLRAHAQSQLDKLNATAAAKPKIPLLPSPAPEPNASFLGKAIQPLADPTAARASNPFLIPLIK